MFKKFKKIKGYSLAEILLLTAILLIICGTLVYAFKANSDANRIYDSVAKNYATPGNILQIESDPSGIKVSSEKYCVSDKLKKLTPFTCSIPRDQSSIVIIAPTNTTIDGNKYTFKGWTGCSKLQDPYSCKVAVPPKNAIKANYTLTSSTKATANVKVTPPPASNTVYKSYSAPGCTGAPDSQQNPDKTWGPQVFCLIGSNIPAGSVIYFKNFVHNQSFSTELYGLDEDTLFATCYSAQGIDSDACEGVHSAASKATTNSPIQFQRGNTANGQYVKILKPTTAIVSSVYRTQSNSCGVSCVSSGHYYVFESWQIEKTANNDGAYTYAITTYRKLDQ
jgi:hypothetical protein